MAKAEDFLTEASDGFALKERSADSFLQDSVSTQTPSAGAFLSGKDFEISTPAQERQSAVQQSIVTMNPVTGRPYDQGIETRIQEADLVIEKKREEIAPLLQDSELLYGQEEKPYRDEYQRSSLAARTAGINPVSGRSYSESAQKAADKASKQLDIPKMRLLIRNAGIFVDAGIPADFEHEWNRIVKGGEWAEKIPFSPAGLTKMIELNNIAGKMKGGQDLTEYERVRMNEFAADEQLKEEVGKTIGAGVFEGVTDMIPYALEFMATGSIASGARAGATRALGKVAEKRAVSVLTQGAAAGLARTIAQPHKVIEGTLERRLNQVDLKDNKAIINETIPQRSLLSSFTSSFLDTLAENISEEAGATLMGLPRATRNKLVKMGLWKAAKEANPSIKPSQFRQAMRKLGKGGIVEEWTEERYGAVLRELFGVDADDRKDGQLLQRLTYFNMSDLFTELGVLAVGGGPSTIAGIAERGRMNQAEAKALGLIKEELNAILDANPEINERPEIRAAVEQAIEDPSQENLDVVYKLLSPEEYAASQEEQEFAQEAMSTGARVLQDQETDNNQTETETQQEDTVEEGAREPQGAPQEEADIIGISTEEINKSRADRGLDELTEEEVKSHKESMRNALGKGLNNDAETTAQKVLESADKGKVRQLSDEEVAGFGARIVELRNERVELFAQLKRATAQKDQNRIDDINFDLDQNAQKSLMIEDALKTSATAAGRATSMMASFINRFTYDVVSLENVAVKAKGDALTNEERQGLINIADKIAEIEEKIADLKEQIRTGQFKEAKPKRRRRDDEPAELTILRTELAQLQREAREKIYAIRRKNWRDHLKNIITLPRTMMATADMSYGLRQGLIPSFGHPVIATSAWRKAFKAFWSQNAADEIDVQMKDDPMYEEMLAYGLHFSNIDSAIEGREEFFASNIAEKIPIFGRVVQASERNMVTGLNMLRYGLMRDFVLKHPDASFEIRKKYAKYINIVTGRGEAKFLDKTAEELSALFFAPRFMVSRIQSPYVAAASFKHPELRGEIIRQWSALLATGMTILALARAAGADVGDDPDDSDWGKIIIDGKIRIDLFGGLQQPLRLLAKTVKGGYTQAVEGESNAKPIDDILNFFRYKMSPPFMMLHELISGKDVVGRDIEPIPIGNFEIPEVPSIFVKNITPLIVQSAAESYQENLDPSTIAALAIGEGAGLSIGVYEKDSGRMQSRSRRISDGYGGY